MSTRGIQDHFALSHCAYHRYRGVHERYLVRKVEHVHRSAIDLDEVIAPENCNE